ncbi:MAG: tRNA pseudouridine(38-40) synthase TruA [Bacteroidia bacterium]|nr:tRNA pseudouridine(38-40) synthase TruA [Bacteroidia bacterium]
MQRYFIQLAYNGTAYHGWQIQENTPNTIQQVLNEKLSLILNELITVTGCGRTDTGVHAKDFYAHFDSEKIDIAENEFKWIHKLNSVLPNDIAAFKIFKVKNDANARFDAISRTYDYVNCTSKNPFLIDTAYFIKSEPDIEKMNNACKVLFEYIDFSCFSKSNTQTFTNNCKILEAHWKKENNLLVFTISADRFLRNMVRAIVGTLLEIGENKITIEELKEIIESKNRSNAGFSVPAGGLFLTKIQYPEATLKSYNN